MSVGECGSVKRGYNHEDCQRVLGVLGDIVSVGVRPYLPLLLLVYAQVGPESALQILWTKSTKLINLF